MSIGSQIGPHSPSRAMVLKELRQPIDPRRSQFASELPDQAVSLQEQEAGPYLPTPQMLAKELQPRQEFEFVVAPEPPSPNKSRFELEAGPYKPTAAMLLKESAVRD